MLHKIEGISVIICCFNSAKRLPQTLKHLSLQTKPFNFPWEIIIINNASTDNTRYVAEQEWLKYDLPSVGYVIVDELTPGLSNAREKGITHSKFEFLIFCDDDNWLNPLYLETMHSIFATNSKIGAVGGYGIPEWEDGTSKKMKVYADYFATGKQAEYSGDITLTKKYSYGAGMGVRKSAIISTRKKGYKTFLTDRIGNKLTSGGDNELCYQLILNNYKIWYEEALTFKHFIPLNRSSSKYFNNLIFSYGYSSAMIWPYINKLNKKSGIKCTILYEIFNKLYFLVRYILIKPRSYFEVQGGNYENKKITIKYNIGYIYGVIAFSNKISKLKKHLNSIPND